MDVADAPHAAAARYGRLNRLASIRDHSHTVSARSVATACRFREGGQSALSDLRSVRRDEALVGFAKGAESVLEHAALVVGGARMAVGVDLGGEATPGALHLVHGGAFGDAEEGCGSDERGIGEIERTDD